jgi:hypothetical protein
MGCSQEYNPWQSPVPPSLVLSVAEEGQLSVMLHANDGSPEGLPPFHQAISFDDVLPPELGALSFACASENDKSANAVGTKAKHRHRQTAEGVIVL